MSVGALEDVHTSEGLVCAQIILHKHLILSSIRRLCVFDGQDCVGVSNVKEYPERQSQHFIINYGVPASLHVHTS